MCSDGRGRIGPCRAVRSIEKPAAAKKEKSAAAKESTTDVAARAKDPLHIVISINKQQLTLYSGAQAIAHSRVSTGTASHPTPTGVFSVIQKNRWHRSNLYNDAPMFYMQRITWSGVAMHQGIVPNHPASHGCIRLPEAFARQLWGITKLGARVIIARGDVAPVAFAHPRLFIYKQPDPADEAREQAAAATDGSSTDLVKAAHRALETAQAFTKPGATASDEFKPGELAFNAIIRPEKGAPAEAPADLVRSAYNSFDMTNQRRGRAIARPTANLPVDPPDAVRPLKPGPIAVFVSRKEGRVFVRKGFDAGIRRAGDHRAAGAAARYPRLHCAFLQRRQYQPALDGGFAAGRRRAFDQAEQEVAAGAGGAGRAAVALRPPRSIASPSRRRRSTASRVWCRPALRSWSPTRGSAPRPGSAPTSSCSPAS